MKNRGTLILSGMGLNCEKETAFACKKTGASRVDVLHTLYFLQGKVKIKEYDFLIFVGGFLDGDYLGSARVGTNRFKYGSSKNVDLKGELLEFIESGNLILGICNGFQLLVKLGLLPDEDEAFTRQTVSLTQNQKGIFENRWVRLKVSSENNNIFTKNIEKIYLPVRHGEGRVVVTDNLIREKIICENMIAMLYTDEEGNPTDKYPFNPNGSWQNMAALSNKKGNILGMMPHPEAYNHFTNHPHWTRLNFKDEDGDGLKIFRNGYAYLA